MEVGVDRIAGSPVASVWIVTIAYVVLLAGVLLKGV
jgi:hypothetical protein